MTAISPGEYLGKVLRKPGIYAANTHELHGIVRTIIVLGYPGMLEDFDKFIQEEYGVKNVLLFKDETINGFAQNCATWFQEQVLRAEDIIGV